ncbi:MAG: pentapeptide repeat-containing protein [Alistipes sp.]
MSGIRNWTTVRSANAKCPERRFRKSVLNDCFFTESDLTGASFDDCSLPGTVFDRCTLKGRTSAQHRNSRSTRRRTTCGKPNFQPITWPDCSPDTAS